MSTWIARLQVSVVAAAASSPRPIAARPAFPAKVRAQRQGRLIACRRQHHYDTSVVVVDLLYDHTRYQNPTIHSTFFFRALFELSHTSAQIRRNQVSKSSLGKPHEPERLGTPMVRSTPPLT